MTSHAHEEDLQIVAVAAEGEAWLLRLEGTLDIATAGRLRELLQEVEGRAVTLDLSGLEFTDSTGLAVLLEGRVRMERLGEVLRIRGVTGQTRDLLERTRVLERFSDAASSGGRSPSCGRAPC